MYDHHARLAFGGVDRGSKVEVVAGAHVYPADPIGVQWDSSPAIWKAWKHIDVVLLKVVHCYTRCV